MHTLIAKVLKIELIFIANHRVYSISKPYLIKNVCVKCVHIIKKLVSQFITYSGNCRT